MGYVGADGKYYTGQAKIADMTPALTTVWKQGDHDRQRADHKKDLIKPYLLNGEPNPDFMEQYPVESQEVYKFIKSDEEIIKEQ